MTISPDAAEAIALQALNFIAGDEDRLGALMAKSGLSPEDLRRELGDPAFLGSVLDFLLEDEAAVLAFCQRQDIAPETPKLARAALPGAPGDW